MKHLGVVGEIHERLLLFFSSRDLVWEIVVTGERYPSLHVIITQTFSDRRQYRWKATMNLFSLDQNIYEGNKEMFLDHFIDGIKNEIKKGTHIESG